MSMLIPTRAKQVEAMLMDHWYGTNLLWECQKAMKEAVKNGRKSVLFTFDTRSLVVPKEANMNKLLVQLLKIRKYRILKETPGSVTFTWLDE